MRTKTPSPRVSVIVPCYNAEEYIAETIRSVLEQSVEELELIVLNDGSEDRSEAVIQGFVDPRLVYVAKSNSGVADTRNQGVDRARAPVIAFLDADDLYERSNLEKKIDFLDENPDIGVVHSDLEHFDVSGPLKIDRRLECVGEPQAGGADLERGGPHSRTTLAVNSGPLSSPTPSSPLMNRTRDWS